MKKLVIFDDLFFTFANTGIARVWRSLFELSDLRDRLDRSDLDVLILNRSGALLDLPFDTIDFPKLDLSKPSLDRLAIDRVLQYYKADLFVSSYYTFSHFCENLFVAYDMIPENFAFENLNAVWNERQLSILTSEHFLAISDSTKNDLTRYYPWIEKDKVSVAYPAINRELFKRANQSEIDLFAKKHGLSSYFVFVGSRAAEYKNSQLIFELLKKHKFEETFVFVGGGGFSQSEKSNLSNNHILQLDLNDEELVACLSGADCLIYPSLYEGFGIPPLEALAVGTPVVTTSRASLPEVVGNLSVFIGGDSADELLEALRSCQNAMWKRHVQEHGPSWSRGFTWEKFADGFISSCLKAIATSGNNHEIKELILNFTHKSGRMLN